MCVYIDKVVRSLGVKQHLTSAPIITFPNYNLHFRLYTDVSLTAIGAILSQVENDKEHIIANTGHALTAPEKNYSATKRECLGIIWDLQHSSPTLQAPMSLSPQTTNPYNG